MMTQRLQLSRFDGMVGLVILSLIGAIMGLVLLGDRVGVQVIRTAPGDLASSTSRVAIQFSEVMNWDSVVERVVFEPALEGDFSWGGTTLRFRPADALEPGTTYTVKLADGAQSAEGRLVLADTSFSFRVRTPRVAFLMPSDSVPQNVWIADPHDASGAEQATFSVSGVLNYDVSPDGTRVAYAERSSTTGTADLMLLDIESGTVQQLTNCPDADCNTPVWRPDGNMIAYQRVELNTGLSGIGVSPTRVWLLDLTTNPPTNRPLFSDSQILGYAPQWSADGTRIVVYDNSSAGILVYDFTNDSLQVIPTRNGGSDIALSPDGAKVVFPRLIIDEQTGGARSTLQMANLETGEIIDLTRPEEPIDDATSAWNPHGRYLALARRYLDNRHTRTRQLYLLDSETGEVSALINEPRYFNGFFSWDPQGEQLVIQRFPELTNTGEFNTTGRPEVWTYDMDTGEMIPIATNAYFPRWVP